jgi:choline dehydrogenase-like flavoprotein
MDLSAEQDELASLLPLYSNRHAPLRGSRQAEVLLSDWRSNRRALEAAGIHIGRSRLAVRAEPGESDPGCVYCGLCLHGCPYGLIYSTQSTLRTLQDNPDFHYRTDIVVRRLSEEKGSVRIYGHSRTEGTPARFDAARVYLACGVFSTTKILLESLEAYDEPVTIQDSQYFLVPLLRYRGTPNVESERLHTLAQAFLEIRDQDVTAHTVHMEVFTYNDLLQGVAEGRLGPLAPLFRLPVGLFLRRLIVNQCFLHSEVSPTIRARLLPSRGEESGTLFLEGRPNPETKKVVGRVWRKLLAHRGHLRAVPLPPLIQITSPGRGFHSGGSFPMRSTPVRFQSDVWGRPHGLQRIHAVDATVLPTVPATTITLPVMANAHRIASGYDET